MKFRSLSFMATSMTTDLEIRNHLVRSLIPYIFAPEHNMFDEFSDLAITDSFGKPLYGSALYRAQERRQMAAILGLFDELIEAYNTGYRGVDKTTLSSIVVAMMGNKDTPVRSGKFRMPMGYNQIAYRLLRWENDSEISNLGFEMLAFAYNLEENHPMVTALRYIQELVGSYVEEVKASNS